MRNPDRIDPILAQIRDLWAKYPDLRLGQLLVCAIKPSEPCAGIFNIEDDVLSNRLETLADEIVAVPYYRPSPAPRSRPYPDDDGEHGRRTRGE